MIFSPKMQLTGHEIKEVVGAPDNEQFSCLYFKMLFGMDRPKW